MRKMRACVVSFKPRHTVPRQPLNPSDVKSYGILWTRTAWGRSERLLDCRPCLLCTPTFSKCMQMRA